MSSPVDRAGRPGFLYAVSWEVCNPGGGVHTVLATSAAQVHAAYGEDLLYIGPDHWAERSRQSAFEQDAVQPPLAALAAERDIPVRFGRWKVDGAPRVALVDFGRLLEHKNRILGDFWNDYGVDSIHADWDTVEHILFGHAAGMLVELHYHATVRPRALRAAAHFHQWQASAGVLRLTRTTPEIGTVYTPHGTALGRGLSAAGVPVHAELDSIAPDDAAREHGLAAPHTLEKAAARHASVLTAVSDHSAEEAARLLGRRPDLVTPNGYTAQKEPDSPHHDEVRAAIIRNAERFLGSPLDPAATRLLFCSGRYEFRNKGFGVAIRALGRLRTREPAPPRKLVCLLFVTAPQTGRRPEVTRRLKDAALSNAPCGVCTHNLAHPESDLILQACAEAGLCNRPEDSAHLIFVPVLLDRRDPVFPFSYTDVLQASDLSMFPSLYEPWGYTPVESLAAGVPTITTDLTGFGRFVLALPEGERTAVAVLRAAGTSEDGIVKALETELARFLDMPDEELAGARQASAPLLARTAWDGLIDRTFEAHRLAVERTSARPVTVLAPGLSGFSPRSLFSFPGVSATRPQLHRFTVAISLPERIERLAEIARNPWWSWSPAAQALFERLDPGNFSGPRANPVKLLRTIDTRRLAEAARDEEFLARYDRLLVEFDDYLQRPAADVAETAYFCAEFGIHESLPIYSGGLGVLAGDHLKSASDRQLPLVGVGLRYANGYFVQRIQPDGHQGVEYLTTDVRDTPLVEVRDDAGEPLRISIRMPERELHAGVWRVDVGRVPLYLLDTMVPENDPADQGVTDRLYPSDREHRLRQEILLGMGGWQLLAVLGRRPRVCHLNEGHSAFLLLQRLLTLVERKGLTFAEAELVVRAGTVFTTHTPVPAGHDRFPEGLMRRYFGHVAQALGLDWEEFLDLGRTSRDEHEFSMTVLALRLSGRANGVSRLHGEISRGMLADVWAGIHDAEAPVDSVTNGVHLPSWAGRETGELIGRYVSSRWRAAAATAEEWQGAESIPDRELWSAHLAQKRRMVRFLRESVEETGLRRGESPAALRKRLEGLDENALWIGYARRFAPYKRATMLFQDPARLARLLDDPERPVRVVFAGKSHPEDAEGAELVRQVVAFTTDPRFAGRVFFVEDYDLGVGRVLVQGCDVWLNTPTPPLEASGTSGMKACLNGGLHCSILDGWWCEGYDEETGWVFGGEHEYDSPEMQREHDSRSLYGLLESSVVPLYFERDDAGLPEQWLARMKRTLANVPAQFNTDRMVEDYVRFAYSVLGERAEALEANEYAAARERAAFRARLREAWQGVLIEDVSVTDLSRGSIGIGDVFEVRARVRLGGVSPEEVAVELYVGPVDASGKLREPVVIPLLREGEIADGVANYTGAYLPVGAGSFLYGVRVMPALDDFMEAAHLGLIRWA